MNSFSRAQVAYDNRSPYDDYDPYDDYVEAIESRHRNKIEDIEKAYREITSILKGDEPFNEEVLRDRLDWMSYLLETDAFCEDDEIDIVAKPKKPHPFLNYMEDLTEKHFELIKGA